jgi:asparagine synthase (glutamine-hydrolysing)
MGGIEFLIYCKQNIGIDFIKGFMKIKHRGQDDSNYFSESTVDINSLSQQQMSQVQYILSRAEITQYIQYNFIYAYHRSAITDITYNATQPFNDPILNMINLDNADRMKNINEFKNIANRPNRKLMCNGEIYNYSDLIETNNFSVKDIQSNCDVEVILPLYIKNLKEIGDAEESIIQTVNQLKGEFSFVLTENVNTFVLSSINTFIARDFLGIRPLYYIYNTNNNFWLFVSEIKAIPNFIINNSNYTIKQLPPGSIWSFQKVLETGNPDSIIKYYDINKFRNLESCTINKTDPDTINEIYTNIVKLVTDNVLIRYKHTQRPIGFLLSGGFDSSILISIIMNYLSSLETVDQPIQPIQLFTMGDSLGSDDIDIEYAKELVSYLEDKYPQIHIEHHIVYVNNIEILTSDIETVIYHLESYEPEMVRESIPYYYLFKYISEKTDVKILITGDGMDEQCGYSEFNNLDDSTFQTKSVDLFEHLCEYDALRLDKISNAFGLETRQPYLDKDFVEYMLSIHPKIKKSQIYSNTEEPIEKYIIRKAFEVENNFLPENILWRRAHCVCESLTNFELRLSNYFNDYLSDQEYDSYLEFLMTIPGVNMKTLPTTKEELYYRKTFENIFPNRSYLVPLFWSHLWE